MTEPDSQEIAAELAAFLIFPGYEYSLTGNKLKFQRWFNRPVDFEFTVELSRQEWDSLCEESRAEGMWPDDSVHVAFMKLMLVHVDEGLAVTRGASSVRLGPRGISVQ